MTFSPAAPSGRTLDVQRVEIRLVMRELTGALKVVLNSNHGRFWHKRDDTFVPFNLRPCGNYSRITEP